MTDTADPIPAWRAALLDDDRYEELAKPPTVADHWVHGDPAPRGLSVTYYIDRAGRRLVGLAHFGSRTSGHAAIAHGGAIATLMDDALGTAGWLAGEYVVSLELTTRFERYVPVGAAVRIDAWVTSVDGRKVCVDGRISGAGDETYATATARFLQVAPTAPADTVERTA